MKRATASKEGNGSVRIAAGLLVLAMAVAGTVVWGTRTSSQDPRPLEQVTIAANTFYAGSCPILAAHENGYFGAEGLNVTIQPHTSGKAALDAVLEDKASLGVSADIPIMFAGMRQQPIAVIATIFASESDYEVVGRKDRGITTPASLRGKRIGVSLGTSGHFVLDAFLNRQKLSPSDVTAVDLKPEDIAPALARGDIDAAATWEPHVSAMKKALGTNSTAFSATGIYEATSSVSGTRDYVENNQEAVKKVLRALIQGGRFCQDAPEQAREMTGRFMKFSAEELKEPWALYRFRVVLDQSLLLTLEDEARWAIKNGLVGDKKEMPNYLNNIHLDGLLAVMPRAVTVIH
ncbi:NrtA/SsuA/CpmA family ABC transporter substrate-binding protein [Acidovorax sp. Root267]|uniref:ABC transporter substrate-binding protein n=1 Tax=Acidovorax sp. Root267 TaxID=1736505 RepID=UPI001F5B544A|nr:NrtA/SsuA/CpmA family ABC transporter substrate-binding protein [Acidovorax sp. Root267]